LLAGLLRPTGGRLLYEGKDVWQTKGADLARFRKAVQLVHQDPYASLNPTRTVFQTLSAPLFRHKKARTGRQALASVNELLQRVDLTPPENFVAKYPHQLSGGQRQRVAIARALTVDPKVIVADEAVSMVDVSIRISLLNLLLALPPGCTFHPRCPLFEAGLCDVKIPELLVIPGSREVACHVAVRERTSERAAATA